jgi:hypothetical protein
MEKHYIRSQANRQVTDVQKTLQDKLFASKKGNDQMKKLEDSLSGKRKKFESESESDESDGELDGYGSESTSEWDGKQEVVNLKMKTKGNFKLISIQSSKIISDF